MRRSSTLVLALLVVSASAWAQPSPEQMQHQAQKRMNEMIERLELTEEQQEQVRPIMKSSARQTRKLRDKARTRERTPENRDAMRGAMQQIQRETRKQLAGVLGAEQLTEYDALIEEWRAERRARNGGGGRGM